VPGGAGESGRVYWIQRHLLRTCARTDPRLLHAAVLGLAAVGYASLHNEQQKELVDAAFRPATDNLVRSVQGTGRATRS